jgi:hypothetical protein
MNELEKLRVAVGLLAHVSNTLVSTVARLAERVDDPELRKELLDSLEIVMQATGSVVEMFPPPDSGPLH